MHSLFLSRVILVITFSLVIIYIYSDYYLSVQISLILNSFSLDRADLTHLDPGMGGDPNLTTSKVIKNKEI